MSRVQIIETGKRYGNMNVDPSFFPQDYSKEMCKQAFLENRKKVAAHYGCNPLKFYIPTQQRDGSYQVLTKEMVQSCEDGWDLFIPADILIVTDKTPEVVAGFSVADCAVVIMADLKNGVTATAHCSAAFIDQHLPQMTLEALKGEYDSQEENIAVYVSACAGPDWTYDCFPNWATDQRFWEEAGAIQEEAGRYRIDIRKAIAAQLDYHKFKRFIINPTDTITSDNFYSNSASSNQVPGKAGRHFAGVFYIKNRRS